MKAFSINIVGLSKKANHFNFELGDEFFEKCEYGAVSAGKLNVTVVIDKHDTFIEAGFRIDGQVGLTCDRSLRPFDQRIAIDKQIVFKYGDEETELSDEIVVISRDRATLDLSQYIFEFIVLELPMKRLHPDLRDDENEEGDGKIIYTSADDKISGTAIDPRWEQLKKLK